jgi:hypothetical protein
VLWYDGHFEGVAVTFWREGATGATASTSVFAPHQMKKSMNQSRLHIGGNNISPDSYKSQ